MRKNVDKVAEWIECPIKSLILEKQDNKSLINLKRVFLHYYYSMQYSPRNKTETYLKKWYSKLEKNPMTPEEIIVSKCKNKKIVDNIMAAERIHEFCEKENKRNVIPIAVEQKYNIKIGKIFITGTIDVIREVNENKHNYLEIVKYNTDEFVPNKHALDYDFSLTMDVMAFRRLFLKKEDRVVVHHVATGNEIVIKKEDYQIKWLQKTLSIVGDEMANGSAYPKYTKKCGICECRKECEKLLKGK